MTGKSKEKFDKGEAVFKLQAYASKVFNEYAAKRAKNKKVLDGDIVTRRENKELQYGIYNVQDKRVQPCIIKSDNKDFFFVPETKGIAIPYEKKMIVT